MDIVGCDACQQMQGSGPGGKLIIITTSGFVAGGGGTNSGAVIPEKDIFDGSEVFLDIVKCAKIEV